MKNAHMDLTPFLEIFQKRRLISLIMVVPHLPCLDWWPLARITASWVGIENDADSFVVNDQPVGVLSFNSWLVRFKKKGSTQS